MTVIFTSLIFTLGESVLIEPSWLELLLLEILPPPVRAWFMKSDSVKLIFDWWIGESKLWWICELSLGVFFLVCPKNGFRLIVEISSILNNKKNWMSKSLEFQFQVLRWWILRPESFIHTVIDPTRDGWIKEFKKWKWCSGLF